MIRAITPARHACCGDEYLACGLSILCFGIAALLAATVPPTTLLLILNSNFVGLPVHLLPSHAYAEKVPSGKLRIGVMQRERAFTSTAHRSKVGSAKPIWPMPMVCPSGSLTPRAEGVGSAIAHTRKGGVQQRTAQRWGRSCRIAPSRWSAHRRQWTGHYCSQGPGPSRGWGYLQGWLSWPVEGCSLRAGGSPPGQRRRHPLLCQQTGHPAGSPPTNAPRKYSCLCTSTGAKELILQLGSLCSGHVQLIMGCQGTPD